MTNHVKTKQWVNSIPTVQEFEQMLHELMLSEEEMEIMRDIYRRKYTMNFIADKHGMSERTVIRKHRNILNTVSSAFDIV